MIVQAIKTQKITAGSISLTHLLDQSISSLNDYSVVIITSKVVSLCEGRVKKIGSVSKQQLIEEEASHYIPPEQSKYNISLTITRNTLIPTAGIDESNGNGYYILWPKNPQETAVSIKNYLIHKFKLEHIGVIITDSKTTPMRYGTTGISIGYAGFMALNNYIGTPDLFGRNLEVTQSNVADGLAASAVVIMGEGSEQTPLAVISDIPFVHFDANAPTQAELELLHISPQLDIYHPLIKNAPWLRGKGK